MPWPVHPTGFFGARGDNDTYRIERSLRFNSADSANLTRTPSSAGNRKTFTISFWAKRSNLSSNFHFIQAGPDTNTITSFSIGENGGSPDNINLTFFDYQSGSYTTRLITTQVFRDTSSWMHFVASIDTTQSTSSSRVRIYVNGGEITSFSTATYPNQNQDLVCNNNVAHRIGSYVTTRYSDGYITEYNFIDGQALTPSSFGETDPITGRWKAKAYSGTYGTNGFYLKFADNSGTTATTLGKDSSGNGNNWTPNNFSVSAYAANDSLVDSPTNYGSDTGLGGEVRGNYATLNPISTIKGTIIDGNLRTNAGDRGSIATIGMSSGKWFCEMYVTTLGAESSVGISRGLNVMNTYVGASSDSWGYYYNGLKYNNATSGTYGSSYTAGDTVGVAFDADAGTLIFTKNGTSQGTAFTGLTSGPYYFAVEGRSSTAANDVTMNFGQQAWKYAPPSGYKALCTTNLPTPTIKKPSSAMDIVTYTGNGSARSITGLSFSPDLVWIKGRSGATDHAIYDSVRGVQNDLGSNLTTDETTQTQGLTAFNLDGFDIGTLAKLNTNTSTYVAWAWDRAAIDGLDIVSYTGNGANRTIAHNLGVAPKMIIVKARTTAGTDQGWPVWHESIPNTNYLMLDTTALSTSGATYWNSTSPTASVFSLGTNAAVNANNDTYIAYLFAEVEGFSRFGSYTGNASADGPFVWCGFRPRWVMTKSSGGTTGYAWIIHDTARNPNNVADLKLVPNNNQVENGSSVGGTTFNTMDILSNGFKLRSTNVDTNQSSGFIFAAFAESPFKYARAR